MRCVGYSVDAPVYRNNVHVTLPNAQSANVTKSIGKKLFAVLSYMQTGTARCRIARSIRPCWRAQQPGLMSAVVGQDFAPSESARSPGELLLQQCQPAALSDDFKWPLSLFDLEEMSLTTIAPQPAMALDGAWGCMQAETLGLVGNMVRERESALLVLLLIPLSAQL